MCMKDGLRAIILLSHLKLSRGCNVYESVLAHLEDRLAHFRPSHLLISDPATSPVLCCFVLFVLYWSQPVCGAWWCVQVSVVVDGRFEDTYCCVDYDANYSPSKATSLWTGKYKYLSSISTYMKYEIISIHCLSSHAVHFVLSPTILLAAPIS